MKVTYKHILYLILIANFYYLPVTIYLIVEKMGPMGFGLFVFPFSVGINVICLTAIFDIIHGKKKFQIINTIGLTFTIGLSLLLGYFRLTA